MSCWSVGNVGVRGSLKETTRTVHRGHSISHSPPNSVAQSRPFNLLIFQFWSIFSHGSKRLTFYFQVFWASEQRHARSFPGTWIEAFPLMALFSARGHSVAGGGSFPESRHHSRAGRRASRPASRVEVREGARRLHLVKKMFYFPLLGFKRKLEIFVFFASSRKNSREQERCPRFATV